MQPLDVIQLVGIVELFIAAGISFVLAIATYRKYTEKQSQSTLIFVLDFILISLALAFVAVDRILLTYFMDAANGLLFHNLAIYISLGVIILLDVFAFLMTYPDQVKKLTVIVVVLMIAAGVILYYNQPTLGAANEIIYADEMLFIILPLLAPPIFVPIVVFFSYAAKVREESKPQSNRALVMGIAAIVVSIGYIFELMGIVGILVIIVRLSFVIFALLMYISFTMPQWFKNIIGVKEV